jgi:hypothetical protein
MGGATQHTARQQAGKHTAVRYKPMQQAHTWGRNGLVLQVAISVCPGAAGVPACSSSINLARSKQQHRPSSIKPQQLANSPNFIMVYGIWRHHRGTRDLNRLQHKQQQAQQGQRCQYHSCAIQ